MEKKKDKKEKNKKEKKEAKKSKSSFYVDVDVDSEYIDKMRVGIPTYHSDFTFWINKQHFDIFLWCAIKFRKD